MYTRAWVGPTIASEARGRAEAGVGAFCSSCGCGSCIDVIDIMDVIDVIDENPKP